MYKRLNLAVFCATLLVSSFAAQKSDERVIEDKDYCFRLELPAKEWKVIDSANLTQISSRALAGAVSSEGTGFVYAGPTFTSDLDELSQAFVDGLHVENKQVIGSTKLDFQNSPAVRIQIDGTTNGLLVRWDCVLVVHKQFVYQICMSAPSARAKWSAEDLAPYQAAFKFFDGTPRVPSHSNANDHAAGVGWELEGGVFRSAVFGFEAKAEPPWRLLTGKELKKNHPSAHIGWRYDDPSVTVVFVPEKAEGAELDSIVEAADARFQKMERGTESMAARVLGRDMLLEQRFPSAAGLECLCGRLKIEDMVIKVIASYPRDKSHQARPLIHQVLESTRLVEGKERTALIDRLKARPDSENRVGPTYCLRNGVYRDFASGFTWTKPPGFWRVKTGEDAHATSKTCVIAMEDANDGLLGLVHVSNTPGQDAHRLIQAKMNVLFGEEQASTLEPTSIDLGEVKGWTVSGPSKGKLPLTYCLTVATTKDRAFQLVLSGTPKMVERSRDVINAAQHAFRVSNEPTQSVTADEHSIRDARLGYELRNPDGWTEVKPDLGTSQVMASAASWKKGGSEIYVCAICPDTEGQDPSFLIDMLRKSLPAQFAPLEPSSFVESTEEFAGGYHKRMTFMVGNQESSVLWIMHDGTCYELCSAGPIDSGVQEIVKRCFALVH
jgi:hypothetical protein